MGSDADDKNNNDWQRRDILKLGATGLVASLSGCAPAVFRLPDSTPEVGGLVDPSRLQSETWQEPWIWRPEQWPGNPLELTVVRRQNPGMSTSPGNPAPSLFSFNGASPGPTVRVRNDAEVRFKVRNTLGLNEGNTIVGPAPDPVDMTPAVERAVCSLAEEQVRGGDPSNPRRCNPFFFPEQTLQVTRAETIPSWAISGHMNGLHSTHVTNLHTHGLHVFPNMNPDGTHSDDVHLRILPNADWEKRLASGRTDLQTLAHNEHVGQLDYKMLLSFERDGQRMPHPPGTHWYHPHSHGSTHDQVSSGMAGFLVVEGDVDESINMAMTGESWPDPELAQGPYDYRERLVFFQRVMVQSHDRDAGERRNGLRFPQFSAINGAREPSIMRMRPGAVERWRILNGSVDGAGTKRFMVLDGQYVQRDQRIWKVVHEGEGENATRRFEPVSEQDYENAKLDLQQLAFDGITLVSEEDGRAVHRIKDLSTQNAGTENPFAKPGEPGQGYYEERLAALESVYRDGDSLRRAYVRPNEIYLTNANRADAFFKAPPDAAGRVFTIFAKEAHIHTDNHQRFLQKRIKDPNANARRDLFDVVIAYIHVDGDAVEGGDFDIQSLNAHLPPVPPLLLPVREHELEVPADEAAITGVKPGSKRCRSVSYSGAGGADFPSIEVPKEFAAQHPELENLTWGMHEDTPVLLPPLNTTMAINTEFDLTVNPEPGVPRKFMPDDEQGSRMLVNTAEEWALFNNSMMMWVQADRERFPQPGSFSSHFRSFPIVRAEGQRRFAMDKSFMIAGKANDHPFHIHINPMWVLRIDVPDENGELHNVLPEPVWMDTVPIPRNGGRVVFRSRFDDFTGKWVNHCHVLQHEDLGMMQEVKCTDDPKEVNYHVRDKAADPSMSGAEVDAIYPKPSLETMYLQNMTFIDPNEKGYQVFPGFELEVPSLDD